MIRVAERCLFGEFSSFSEFWQRRLGLDPEDMRVVNVAYNSLPKPAVAADVGANLGLFTLALAASGFSTIHAFEPIPETCNRLRANVRRNPRFSKHIVVDDRAVGSFDGTINLLIQPQSPGQNKIVLANIPPVDSRQISREILKLDSYFASPRIPAPSFLKIDVEGFETEVLKGSAALLRGGQLRFIYVEIIEQALNEAGSSSAELCRLLGGAGFEPVIVNGGTLSVVSFAEAMSWAKGRRNVLFRVR